MLICVLKRCGKPWIVRATFSLLLATITVLPTPSQDASTNVHITVHADRTVGSFSPIWSFFGYDEPNYTYAPNGKKLLGEFSALSPAPVYVRVHNLFTTGDGSASLKWG